MAGSLGALPSRAHEATVSKFWQNYWSGSRCLEPRPGSPAPLARGGRASNVRCTRRMSAQRSAHRRACCTRASRRSPARVPRPTQAVAPMRALSALRASGRGSSAMERCIALSRRFRRLGRHARGRHTRRAARNTGGGGLRSPTADACRADGLPELDIDPWCTASRRSLASPKVVRGTKISAGDRDDVLRAWTTATTTCASPSPAAFARQTVDLEREQPALACSAGVAE